MSISLYCNRCLCHCILSHLLVILCNYVCTLWRQVGRNLMLMASELCMCRTVGLVTLGWQRILLTRILTLWLQVKSVQMPIFLIFYCDTDMLIHLASSMALSAIRQQNLDRTTHDLKGQKYLQSGCYRAICWPLLYIGYTSTQLWCVGALCWLNPSSELNTHICAPTCFLWWVVCWPWGSLPFLCITTLYRLHFFSSLSDSLWPLGHGCGGALTGRGRQKPACPPCLHWCFR